MVDNRKIGILSLLELKGIGPAFIKKAVSQDNFKKSDLIDEIRELTKAYNKHFDDDLIYEAVERAKKISFECKNEYITIIEYTNSDYPTLLKEIKDPPPILYCKGNVELLHSKTVCLIGTRHPNENGLRIAERIGSFYSNNDWAICNGLAEGIDTYSVKRNGIFSDKVIGVLAGGLNYNTEKTLLKKTAENAEKTVEAGGLLISEFPPGKKEDNFSVVKSCRIQAGLSHGLVLIQSSMDGGSRFTLKAFCETNRPMAIIQPVDIDFDLPAYSANKEIIANERKGLIKFIDIKEDKINTSTISVIKSKDDYTAFETVINHSINQKVSANSNLF